MLSDGSYLSEGVPFRVETGLLCDVHDPLALLVPLVHLVLTRDQAHQKHETYDSEQGEDSRVEGRHLKH